MIDELIHAVQQDVADVEVYHTILYYNNIFIAGRDSRALKQFITARVKCSGPQRDLNI